MTNNIESKNIDDDSLEALIDNNSNVNNVINKDEIDKITDNIPNIESEPKTKEQLNEIFKQLKKIPKDKLNKLMELYSNANKINPNGKEFEGLSESEIRKKMLKDKLNQMKNKRLGKRAIYNNQNDNKSNKLKSRQKILNKKTNDNKSIENNTD